MIAYHDGGVTEIVLDAREVSGGTGWFFHKQAAECLMEAIVAFEGEAGRFDPQRARTHSERFSVERYERELLGLLSSVSARWESPPVVTGEMHGCGTVPS